ncbi:hypothetical protein TCAL_11907 [Tigriopus californicus]|uniref:Dipeptidyl peptidase 3 n=1 Tax=Tigriopus californicus TaxID=6832 RepID=A0A553PJM2_TIGCA|nr:hypothetical protein TCAL_11907 [Tigriopus californicus]
MSRSLLIPSLLLRCLSSPVTSTLLARSPCQPQIPGHKVSSAAYYHHGVFRTESNVWTRHSASVSDCPIDSPSRSTRSASTMAPISSQYVLPNDQPVIMLDAIAAFQALSPREKLYAHYLSRASFFGGLIVLLQTSLESPQIFRLIQRIHLGQSTEELKAAVIKAGLTEEDFQAFLVYGSGVYANMGNYKGFGDSKIIPNLPVESFETLIKASAAYKADTKTMDEIWSSIKEQMYSLTERQKQLGLGAKGVTKYFSDNCTTEDADKINRYLQSKKIEGYMNRAIKTEKDGQVRYEIRHAGVAEKELSEEVFEGATFVGFASNSNEENMLDNYIKAFELGSLDAHKEGSRYWIKNKGPVIETYIGFIENYRDPLGMRGEFEGFVAMVNKEQSAKFQVLVEKAEDFLPRLPWPREFEKDKFLLPDFTSLDVLYFSGSGIPAGINIPNYDEIRQSEGFKNVNLGNVIASSYKTDSKTTFVSETDHEILKKWRVPSFEVQVGTTSFEVKDEIHKITENSQKVGLHELLGHGSGKLLQKTKSGELNYPKDLKNPLTGEEVAKVYEAGETFDSVFTSLGSSYEECRAEAVGLYLSTYKDVTGIFGYNENADDLIYANWLSLCHAALKGVEMFSPGTKEWKQAHSQARFVLLQVMIEAGQGFVDVNEITGEDGKPDLILTIDRTKLESVGKPAIGEFLMKLQVYKSLGDIENAKKMYDELSEVKDTGSHPFGKWREIILARKTPRKIMVQHNTVNKDQNVEVLDYHSSHEGMAKSWVDRLPADEYVRVDAILDELYQKDLPHFSSNA